MESNLTQIPEVVVVGAAAQKFTCDVVNWLRSREIHFVLTENVYSATALIGQVDNRLKVFVIGTFEELSKEGMRFFDIAAAIGSVTCCCLEQSARDSDITKTAIVEKPAVLAISRLDDLEGLLFHKPDRNE
ncbi:MAG: hypothetical protein GWO86_02625, partial [Planctomycetes bacterium]|nr:hypothetical protein [Planctomycetota bacterium]